MTPDEALVKLLRDRGDRSAFHQLYSRHTPMLFALALRITGERDDAEDVVHDTWLRAVEGIGRFRGDSSVRTWLAGILVNRARESLRAQARLVPIEDSSSRVIPSVDDAVRGCDRVDIERALTEMPRGYREIVVLHDVEGFTHAEIGAMLGIDAGTSKSQLTRGRRWLRSALEPGVTEKT